MAMNGDMLARPEEGVSPETLTRPGPGHRRFPGCLEMHASTGRAWALAYSSFALLVRREVYLPSQRLPKQVV